LEFTLNLSSLEELLTLMDVFKLAINYFVSMDRVSLVSRKKEPLIISLEQDQLLH
jgi:hypothetical protein